MRKKGRQKGASGRGLSERLDTLESKLAGFERHIGSRTPTAPRLDGEDPSHQASDVDVEEAEVRILRREPSLPVLAGATDAADAPFAAGSLRDRLRRARMETALDGESYAAYRVAVEEASVEIIFPPVGPPSVTGAGKKGRPAVKRPQKSGSG